MPVMYDSIIPREKGYKTALKYDFIDGSKFLKYENDYTTIIAKSVKRVANSKTFNSIASLNRHVNKVYSDKMPPIALKLDDVYQKIKEIDVLWKKVKAQDELPMDVKIRNNSYNAKRVKNDNLLREINKDKMKEAQSNPYLAEAVNIISDWNAQEN